MYYIIIFILPYMQFFDLIFIQPESCAIANNHTDSLNPKLHAYYVKWIINYTKVKIITNSKISNDKSIFTCCTFFIFYRIWWAYWYHIFCLIVLQHLLLQFCHKSITKSYIIAPTTVSFVLVLRSLHWFWNR